MAYEDPLDPPDEFRYIPSGQTNPDQSPDHRESLVMLEKPYGLSVKALVRGPDDRYLFILRSKDSHTHPGLWDLPGGKVETGEHFVNALVREAHEETGLAITVERFLGASEFELEKFRVVNLIMLARLVDGASDHLLLSAEHSDHRWVARSELMDLSLCPPTRSILDAYSREAIP